VSSSRRSAGRACSFRASVSLAVLALAVAGPAIAQWQSLAKDGLHDPKSPAVRILQEPREALSRLPKDGAGNFVDWNRALGERTIQPRSKLRDSTEVRTWDADILLNLKGGTPIVRFPHRQHTMWLDCSNCHEQLFRSRAGANPLSMLAILQGEQCGVCHGAVAFPLTECKRCHNTPR
jgi:c(7)-type cytochrome triheme protein